MFHRGSLIDILLDWLIDRLIGFEETIFRKKKPKEFTAIKIVPETDPDRCYHDWISGERIMLNDLPEVQLTILKSEKSIDEIVEIICDNDPLVLHTGHKDDCCPGEPLSDGLRKLFSDQPSTWQIRTATPGPVHNNTLNIVTLEMFLAQEFEGSAPGNPNRDICTIWLNRELAPMELELRIPHYGVRNGYCSVVYLRIDLKIDPKAGVLVTGHEDNMDSRPR